MRWQRYALKVAILTKMATLTKMANSRQNVTNIPMTWQRDPSESGYFGENGIFGENMAKFAKGAPWKVANSAKIDFTKV